MRRIHGCMLAARASLDGCFNTCSREKAETQKTAMVGGFLASSTGSVLLARLHYGLCVAVGAGEGDGLAEGEPDADGAALSIGYGDGLGV